MIATNTLSEILEIVDFASTPPTLLPTKESKDPFQLVTQTLCDRILSSSFHDSFQSLQLESVPSTSAGLDVDSRQTYADVLRFVLSTFCDEAVSASLPADDWTVLSSKQIGAIIRTFELLIAMSILPSIDAGIGVPLEKRVNFVKVWKSFTDVSQRIEQLRKTLHVFHRLCEVNENLKLQIISKFLPDFISANEQLIHLNDPSLEEERYKTFLKGIPLSVVMKEMLLLNGGFGLSGRKVMAPEWFLTSINKKLSEGLASPKGLSHLLMCFNELGGKSFWSNSVILSSVATLLSTKPQCAESFQKYALSMFSQFLDIMKNSKFAADVALLFVLTVDKLASKASFVVEVQLVDKLIRPWEILVERGIQNPSTTANGFWSHHLDNSVVILKSWLHAQPQQYSIKSLSYSQRFLKFVPLFMHFCGQTAEFEELKEFREHLSLIVQRLLGEEIKERGVLMKYMLNDGAKTHGYFKITPQNKLTISEVDESAETLKFPVNLIILEDPEEEESVLDFKIEALRGVVKNLPPSMAVKSLVVLMGDCLNAWIKGDDSTTALGDNIRFVPALGQLVDGSPKRLGAVYVLGSVAEILASLDVLEFANDILIDMTNIAMTIFGAATQRISSVSGVAVLAGSNDELKDVEAQTTALAVGLVGAILANGMDDETLKHALQNVGNEMHKFCVVFEKLDSNSLLIGSYQSAYENCKQLLDLFSNELKWTISETEDSERAPHRPQKSVHNVKKMDEWRLFLESDEEAVKGGALIEVSQALMRRDRNIFSSEDDFEWVWKTAFEHSAHGDSYVFLASINVLAELAYWQTEPFLPRLIESFTNWDENSLSKDVSLMWRGKLGEAIAKVFKQLGNYSVFYFDQFSNSLLHLTKTDDELIRSSALSSFADLIVACRGRKYDTMIHELLFLVSQYLEEDSALVRRSAVNLLRCLLTSAEDSLLSTFADTLRDVHRLLKRLWLHDRDEVVRFHAELALIDLKAIMQRLFA